MKKVSSHNEWDPLVEVIVGIVTNAQYPNNDFGMNASISSETKQSSKVKIPLITQKVVDETKEDLSVFVQELEKLKIVVKRPNPIDTDKEVATPDWKTTQYFNYCPRDTLTVVGNTIIESPGVYRSRYFETLSYRDILTDYLRGGGCRWIAAPKPRLRDEDYITDSRATTMLAETDPMFDAANILRAGKDIFYLVSDSGNLLGYTWLRNVLGDDYRVHACHGLYSGTHIDTTLAFLRPGLVLANPARVNSDNLPPALKRWEVIYAPDMQEYNYSGITPLSSKWLGMNLLMLNPNLAVVDEHQTGLIKLLEKHKIEVLPFKLRHGRLLEGGFHCVTVDVRRLGESEDYFS